MDDEGAASTDAAPSSSSDLERARRALYARGGGSEEAVAGYQRLASGAPRRNQVRPVDDSVRGPVGPVEDDAASADAAEVGEAPDRDRASGPIPRPRRWFVALQRRRRPSARAVFVLLGAAVLTVVVAAAVLVAPVPLPDRVAAPDLPGEELLTYRRAENPESAPRAITFEPADYTVYQPHGRRVAVALRCIGAGNVRISAGTVFTFTCTDRETVQVKTSDIQRVPFLIVGRTTGDVVWGVRIVLLRPDGPAPPL